MTAVPAAASTTLAALAPGQSGVVVSVGGARAFRRRLLELGLVPGTRVRVVKVAPLGDPLELELRGYRLSIRRAEAARVDVTAEGGVDGLPPPDASGLPGRSKRSLPVVS